MEENLEKVISKSFDTFAVGEDLLRDSTTAELLLGSFYPHCSIIQALTIVEYTGQKPPLGVYPSFNTVQVKVAAYSLNSMREENDLLEQAEITLMPHVNFDGRWDE
jgi:hypothetical protein